MTLNSRLTEILELAEKLERQEISRIDYAAFSLRLIPQLVEALKLATIQRNDYIRANWEFDDEDKNEIAEIGLRDAELEAILRRV